PGKVTVRIYTLKGRLLWKQSKTVSDTDTSHITWACQNSRGNVVASGLYIVHVKGPGLDIKKKVAILR
ncbi:MAG: T9SS type A sorting domain-containing protein, partial [Elusimicrobiota bacterium]|nr:T9SS type A sorting domain-containing protein [Elusimicrobiota bacterium]